jgi:phage-related protein
MLGIYLYRCRFQWLALECHRSLAGCILYKGLYNRVVCSDRKGVTFWGRSLDDLREFPSEARHAAGYQIDQVQRGLEPDDWKPMPTIGAGVNEIRISEGGAFRVIYVAKFADTVHVLHCFQKKTQETPLRDIKLAKDRYADLLKDLKETNK